MVIIQRCKVQAEWPGWMGSIRMGIPAHGGEETINQFNESLIYLQFFRQTFFKQSKLTHRRPRAFNASICLELSSSSTFCLGSSAPAGVATDDKAEAILESTDTLLRLDSPL